MWIRAANRRELIDILQAERSLEPSDQLFARYEFKAVGSLPAANKRDELLLVWQDDPRDSMVLPNLVVISSIEQRDFFAWATTYVHGIRPLTAFMRVYDHDAAEKALKVHVTPSLQRLENACVGLILGETATHLGPQKEVSELPTKASAGTYSFVMARALAIGSLRSDTERISDSWFQARELTQQNSLSLDRLSLTTAWQVLLGLEPSSGQQSLRSVDVPRAIRDACLDLYLRGESDKRQWHALSQEVPGIHEVADVMNGPREDRVVVLETIARNLKELSRADQTVRAFILGYLGSQIAPGTLEHLPFLSSYVTQFPSVLLWYGLCAGLYRRSSVSSYAGGLGRWALRELLRDETVLSRPTCDIALSELQMIRAGAKDGIDFLTASHSRIEIEVAPCINATLRWPVRQEAQEPLFSTMRSSPELRDIEFELDDVMQTLRDVTSRLRDLRNDGGTRSRRTERKQRRRAP